MQDFWIWWDSMGWWAHAGILCGVSFGWSLLCGFLERAGHSAMRESDGGGCLFVFAKLVWACCLAFWFCSLFYLLGTGFMALWRAVMGLFA